MLKTYENYEEVLSRESRTLSDDWAASFGEINPDRREKFNESINLFQQNWAKGSGRSLRIFGSTSDVSLAESQSPPVRVIFFGDFYQQDAELIKSSPSLAVNSTHPGPAFILQAYLNGGEAALSKIKGSYAFVLWDGRKDTIWCVRDRIGNIPLFYAETANEILISISMDALLAQPGVSRSVNRIAVAEFLCDRWIRPEETYQTHIKRLLPGYILKVTPGEKRSYRYWEPIPNDQKIEWITESEVKQFDDLLDQAVARTIHDSGVGIFLSGGLDSVTVATLATDLSRKNNFAKPSAYSLIFPYPGASEEDIQRSVAAQLNIPHFIISLLDTLGPGGFIRSALGISDTRPVPVLNLWVPGYQYLTLQANTAGLKTILTGGGGDEWLGVSPYYSADLIRAFQVRKYIDYLKYVKDSFNFSTLRLFSNVFWKFGLRPVLGMYAGEALKRIAPGTLTRRRIRLNTHAMPDWLAPDPDLRKEMDLRNNEYLSRKVLEKTPSSLYVNEIVTGLDHPLVSMEYEESFEGGRRFGIRKSAPFQDYELAEFLIRTPPTYLNRGNKSKGLVRNLLTNRFPELGFDKQKKRAGTPFFQDTLLNEGSHYWEASGGTTTLSELGIVDKPKMDAEVHKIFSGVEPAHRAWFIWHSVCMDSWCKRNY
jgi:asparagine synthetase B (glutamine-hydrolysing)